MRKEASTVKHERDASAVLRRARYRGMRRLGAGVLLFRRLAFQPDCPELAYWRSVLQNEKAPPNQRDRAAQRIMEWRTWAVVQLMDRCGLPAMQRVQADISDETGRQVLTIDELHHIARGVIERIRMDPNAGTVKPVDAEYVVFKEQGANGAEGNGTPKLNP